MKVFVTGPSGPEEEYAPLKREGYEVLFGRPVTSYADQPYDDQELMDLCRDVDAVLASYREFISRRVLEGATRLRVVVVPFIGVDRVDVAAATELGILVANSPSPENFIGVAEATIGLMLALVKRLKHNEALLRRGGWGRREDRGDLLWGKTVGLVGLGRIGSGVAQRLGPWGVRLLAYDPYVSPEQGARLGVTLVDLDNLLRESDFVSLHVVLTSETRHLIGERELRLMKPSAFLINTARGEVVDEEALLKAIEEDWIAGAALDVFHKEPLPLDSPLRRLDPERVILTPHNISHTEAGRRANLEMALESILAALRGEVPEHTVNPQAVPRWRERLEALGSGERRN